MIHIEKGEFVAENPSLKVVTNTGDYEDTALIEFKDVNSEDELVAGAYQAQFVKYGSLVYKFNDPKSLGTEILRIDPESTHTAASFVRMSNELLDQMNGGTLESDSLDKMIPQEPVKPKEPVVEPEVVEEEDDEDEETEPTDTETRTTPPVVIIPDTIPATTTVPIIDTSTTTPALPDIYTPTSTSTIKSDAVEELLREEGSDTPSVANEIVAYAKKKVKKNIRKKLGLN